MSIYDSQGPRFQLKTILLACGAVAVAAAFAGAALLVQGKNVKLGSDLCPVSGPTAQTIVLLDVSDPLTAVHGEALESLLRDFRDRDLAAELLASIGLQSAATYVEKHEVLHIYAMDNGREPPIRELLRVCNPGGDPDDRTLADELVQGEAIARQQWATFEELVRNAFPRELMSQQQATSPILETISVLAERHGQNAALVASGAAARSRLIVFSDMVQNSASLSHFRSLPSWEEFSRLPGFANMGSDLSGFSVSIIYLRRSEYFAVQTANHFSWWPQMISRMNGRMVYYEPVPR